MAKKIIADLPPMQAQDYKEFEETVHPWGRQRATRRQQLQVASAGAVAGAASGWIYSITLRKNTALVGYFMAAMFGVCGGIIGNTAGTNFFPSVATNAETTMMRRMWWAQKCSADWKYDLPADWSQQYPNVDSSKFA